MKKLLYFLVAAALLTAGATGCYNDPIDEAGLLITERSFCYMTFFDVLGSDHRTVLVSGQTKIDTTALTVTAVAKFGTNLTRVKPYCSLVTDAIIGPNMGDWTDFSQPRQYTVTSGDRKVKKTYTITVTRQQ